MTDYKSLTSAAFDTEVQTKITLQNGDPVKMSALLNDYERKLETEDAAQDVLSAAAAVNIRTADAYILSL